MATEQTNYSFPTEKVFLPSKGKVYPKESPLSEGFVEMKYMGGEQEDILTSRSLLDKNTMVEVLLKSLIISNVKYEDILVGDKDALLIAARVLGYGKSYKTDIDCPKCGQLNIGHEFDLSQIKHKEIEGMDDWAQGQREFDYKFEDKNLTITYKLLTIKEEDVISSEVKAMEKIALKTGISKELTTRMKNIIVSVNGVSDKKTINEFVDKQALAVDLRKIRKVMRDNTPGADTEVSFSCSECGHEGIVSLPLSREFFWPRD